MTIIYQCGGKAYKPDTAVTAVFAWLTPALGGYGIPNFTHWASRSTENPLTAGIGTVCRIARTIRHTMPKMHTIIHDCLNCVANLPTNPRSSVAIADDPFGVRLTAVPDPSAVVNRVMRKARDNLVKDESFKSMIQYAASPDYEKAVGAIIRHTNYPASPPSRGCE